MRKTLIENNNKMSRYANSERKVKIAISAMALKFLTFYCFLDVGFKYLLFRKSLFLNITYNDVELSNQKFSVEFLFSVE